MKTPLPPEPERPGESKPLGTTPPLHLQSQELFGNERELLIEHDGAIYRLRITRNGKLLLTK